MIEHFSIHLQPAMTNLTRFMALLLLARCQGLRAATSENAVGGKIKSFPFFPLKLEN